MMITRNTIASRTFAATTAVVLLLVASAGAQINSSAVERTPAPAAQAKAEVTISGTVQRLLNRADAAGGPAGTQLLLSVSGGWVDAHLGPFFSQQNGEALTTGQAVEATGVWTHIHGHEVLLVRQLRVGDRTVSVRNERGFPVRKHAARRLTGAANSATNGGAQ